MVIDVSALASEVIAQAGAVTLVGASCLGIWAGVRAFLYMLDTMGIRDSSVSVELAAASSKAAVAVAVSSVDLAEYQRLGDVWQGWKDQIDAAAAKGGVAPASRQNMRLYDALVERGMDAADAIAAVEARNAAVARSDARADLEEQRQSDALADAHDAAEHAAAIARYQTEPVDLTVRLGSGWQ